MRWPKVDGGEDGLTVDPSCPLVRFTVNGQQVLENTPVEIPIGCQVPESLEMQMMRMIRQEVSRAAVALGHESLDEAYDFEVSEDDSYEEELTPAELHAMVHARELTEEVPRVRERNGSRKESADKSEGAGQGTDRAVAGGRKAESEDNREVASSSSRARADGSRGDDRASSGNGKRSSGVAAEE